MKKLLFTLFMIAAVALSALELVNEGKSNAEIVVDAKACASTQVAAKELQKYLKKISGVELPVVNQPSGKLPVYIGPSEYTRKLGITVDDIKSDGFKVIVGPDYIALIGVDENRLPIPRGNNRFGLFDQLQKEWEVYTGGYKWRVPFFFRDPRNSALGFYTTDATGTLFAVYDLLEMLGCRWYMPLEEIGEVVPELKTIKIEECNIKKEPFFRNRKLSGSSWGKNRGEFLWYKKLRQGGTYDQWAGHTAQDIVYRNDDPEVMAFRNGKLIPTSPKRFLPRLSSPDFRKQIAEYLLKTNAAFPEIPYLPIGQPDGWSVLDDRDTAAGWDKKERGNWGRFSDYMWDMVLDVAGQVRSKSPGLKFSTFSYGYAKEPPEAVIPADIGIFFTQTSQTWHLPEHSKELALRDKWLQKAPESEFYLYDYYLHHNPNRNYPPVPVIFTALMDRNFKKLDSRFKSTLVEISLDPKFNYGVNVKLPGINHLMIYLHCRLSWNPQLDLNAELQDYYSNFFGPVGDEMRRFYEFAETVWMRPQSRAITETGSFLRKEDIPVYFEILDRAKEKAGDGIYRKRVEFIESEIAPLKNLFSGLKRSGPDIRVRQLPQMPEIDGDLTKDIWEKLGGKLWMRDWMTGVYPEVNRTAVAFRWLPDDSLLVGITCYDRRMNELRAGMGPGKTVDEMIYRDDNIEIYLTTPEGYRAKIVVNPNGAFLSRCVTPRVEDVPESWSPVKVVTRKFADHWTVEVQVKDIGVRPIQSMPWGVNVCRQRLAGNEFEGYAVSPTGKGFDKPARMCNIFVQ